MAKEKDFPHPPRGHVAILYYDPANDCFAMVEGDEDGAILTKTVITSMPATMVTKANQDKIVAAVELIDDLRNALDSVGTDEFDVNIEASVALNTQLYAWNGNSWEKLTVDAYGYLKVNIADSYNLPVVLQAYDGDTLRELKANAASELIVSEPDLLTELEAKLETADLNLDGDGDLQVDVKTVPTVTVQAGGGDKIFAFESIVEESVINANLPAGDSSVSGTVVPSGKVWKLTHATGYYVGTVPTRIYFNVAGLASYLMLLWQNSPASGDFYIWDGEVYMQAGDCVQLTVIGATAGDDLLLRYAGVQMDAP